MKINGSEIANKIHIELRKKVKKLKEKKITPHLAVILIGSDPASTAYVRQKELKSKAISVNTTIAKFPSGVSQKNILKTIQQYNNDNNIHGIIVQRPLPSHIDSNVISKSIDPKKDVDGFHPKSKFQPPLALAVLKILKNIFVHLRGGVAPAAHLEGEFREWLILQNIVVIGKGETGGKPVIEMLKKIGAKPLIVDSKTQNPPNITKTADIIISAVGKENTIKPEMIKKNSILISIGLSKGKDGKLHGDYDEDKIKNIASFYTPTPGGVGPINVAMLLKNLVKASES
ncbi:MAG: bifunctional 5,10-methylenetetrahydrofolate dehydrogenase/5,10-methenyltetrahydrofolate cyclohydrolase [Candidatus Levybacteria bacterium]|nr:bifunctional 5,10-methylenetetrahydrofolate dehydrogenase/5,10-methenyltetrahydrofolate cyclohydrolase [Candidatus Levybacteria bacterium]